MNKLRKHSKKGFTLVELIVVIVIIAILVAALTPAILGVIDRANVSADEGGARAIMMAASVAVLNATDMDPANVDADAILAELTGFNMSSSAEWTVWFDGNIAIAAILTDKSANGGGAGATVYTAKVPGIKAGVTTTSSLTQDD